MNVSEYAGMKLHLAWLLSPKPRISTYQSASLDQMIRVDREDALSLTEAAFPECARIET